MHHVRGLLQAVLATVQSVGGLYSHTDTTQAKKVKMQRRGEKEYR
jgi:hypothetical protein